MKAFILILSLIFTAQTQAGQFSQECFIMPREFKARHAVLLELESIKEDLKDDLNSKTLKEMSGRIQDLINIIVEDEFKQ